MNKSALEISDITPISASYVITIAISVMSKFSILYKITPILFLDYFKLLEIYRCNF